MAKTLEEVKLSLYEAFTRAIEKSEASTYHHDDNVAAAKNQAAATYIQAAAQAADALTKVEREITVRDMIRELREQGADVELDIEKGIVRSIAPMGRIKLRQPGDA